MANIGKELNCIAQSGPLSVDPDIVGPGALAAFLASAVITISAVLFAYLSGSLGDEFMNDLDRRVIKWMSESAWNLKTTTLRTLGRPAPLPTASHGYSAPTWEAQARAQAVTQLILSLSDQQLVTGLAILFSGILNQKQLTIYEFSIVLSLAWFSSTTHLATLDALRSYLKTNSIIRHIRVCGMVLILILLSYIFIALIFAAGLDTTLAVQCAFHPWNSTVERQYPMDAFSFSIASWLMALLLILHGYWIRIKDLYFDRGALSRFAYQTVRSLSSSGPTELESQLSPEEAFQVSRAESRTTILLFLLQAPYPIRLIGIGFYLLGGSFLSSLPGLVFSFSWGITQLAAYRWQTALDLDTDSDYMGFGQIVPVFLLALPFLAAGECYYDYVEKMTRNNISGTEDVRSGSSSHSQELPEQGATVTGNHSSDQPMVIAEYAQYLDDMLEYLARDVYHIRELEASQNATHAADRERLTELKKKVLTQYRILKNFEEEMPISVALFVFLAEAFFSATLAVLLNIVTGATFIAATIIFLCMVLGRAGFALGALYNAARVNIGNKGKQEGKQEEQGHNGEGTGVISLIEMDRVTRRSTARLTEEGQSARK